MLHTNKTKWDLRVISATFPQSSSFLQHKSDKIWTFTMKVLLFFSYEEFPNSKDLNWDTQLKLLYGLNKATWGWKSYDKARLRSYQISSLQVSYSLALKRCCALSEDNKHIRPTVNTRHATREINKERSEKEGVLTGNLFDFCKPDDHIIDISIIYLTSNHASNCHTDRQSYKVHKHTLQKAHSLKLRNNFPKNCYLSSKNTFLDAIFVPKP